MTTPPRVPDWLDLARIGITEELRIEAASLTDQILALAPSVDALCERAAALHTEMDLAEKCVLESAGVRGEVADGLLYLLAFYSGSFDLFNAVHEIQEDGALIDQVNEVVVAKCGTWAEYKATHPVMA